MILPDVNVLIYAFDSDAERHAAYATWLNQTLAATALLLPDVVLTGFVRIMTNPRIVAVPVSTESAVAFIHALRTAPGATVPSRTDAVSERFEESCRADPGLRGNLVPDAYLAATAQAHGARLATRDRGFGRFPGLRWFDPADGVSGG